ncbi:MAG: hypothetical protein UW37_C0001G0016 [Candidatus Gottesmanbacteria bacterium GW2011_GWA2_44_17]|uniref:Uncharacterized protein n=1 Tax=Candidatus Gottesmanbacteria bacterium GW2011_GWA2_44_17 TaxID=1618444 RepID=A0A0G1HLE1_9BACT|nr:MAG: hypothetical protein UW37_C0001G0016 [Candidatus Gottesmanbacteria bacterium GW2011_GWA2_44_17]
MIILPLATAQAQQVSLSISPPLLELFIKPGKSIMVAYKLDNLGDPAFINLKVLPFEAKDNLGNIRIKPEFEGPVRFGLDNSDLQLERSFFLKAGGSQQILLRIRIPENITDGDFYYSLLAETAPPTASEDMAGARAKATIGSNILITISNSGNIDVKPRIVLFSTRGGLTLGRDYLKIFDSSDKIPLVFVVENKGKNMIKPEGQITLKGNFGETAKYDIISRNILAESQRLLEATPSSQIDCDDYRRTEQKCLFPTSLLLSGFFIGKYNLSTQINFGENSPMIFGSTSFFAFPFKISAGILITVLIIMVIIKRNKNNKND